MKVVSISVSYEKKLGDNNFGSYGSFMSMTVELDEDEAKPKARKRIAKKFQKECKRLVKEVLYDG